MFLMTVLSLGSTLPTARFTVYSFDRELIIMFGIKENIHYIQDLLS